MVPSCELVYSVVGKQFDKHRPAAAVRVTDHHVG
jgi:hypothetical protein